MSVFARGFNVLAIGGGCTDFIVHGKILSCGVLGLLEVTCFGHPLPRFAVVIFIAIFPLGYPCADVTFR